MERSTGASTSLSRTLAWVLGGILALLLTGLAPASHRDEPPEPASATGLTAAKAPASSRPRIEPCHAATIEAAAPGRATSTDPLAAAPSSRTLVDASPRGLEPPSSAAPRSALAAGARPPLRC